MPIPRPAVPASGSAGFAPSRHKSCRRCGPPRRPAMPEPANISLECFFLSGAPASPAIVFSGERSARPPSPLALPPRPAAGGSRLRMSAKSRATGVSVGCPQPQRENSARCGSRPGAPPASQSLRASPSAPPPGCSKRFATLPTPRTPRQNLRVASSPVLPRPVPVRYPPVPSHIAGSPTSIRPPLQALHKAADRRFLHRRRHLLGHQRFRSIHRQLRRQFFQLHASRALGRFNFRFGRRPNFLHIQNRRSAQPFHFRRRIALGLDAKLPNLPLHPPLFLNPLLHLALRSHFSLSL